MLRAAIVIRFHLSHLFSRLCYLLDNKFRGGTVDDGALTRYVLILVHLGQGIQLLFALAKHSRPELLELSQDVALYGLFRTLLCRECSRNSIHQNSAILGLEWKVIVTDIPLFL